MCGNCWQRDALFEWCENFNYNPVLNLWNASDFSPFKRLTKPIVSDEQFNFFVRKAEIIT